MARASGGANNMHTLSCGRAGGGGTKGKDPHFMYPIATHRLFLKKISRRGVRNCPGGNKIDPFVWTPDNKNSSGRTEDGN